MLGNHYGYIRERSREEQGKFCRLGRFTLTVKPLCISKYFVNSKTTNPASSRGKGTDKMKNTDTISTIAEFDAGIHNPARLMIVYLLSRNKSLDYTQLMNYTELTSGNITTHLNKLAQMGYISVIKSFRGNKPNTAVKLTELGARAYLNWGENILKALPEATKQNLCNSLLNSLRAPKNPFLSLRDGYPYLYAEQAHYLLRGFYGRGVSLPPKDESCVW